MIRVIQRMDNIIDVACHEVLSPPPGDMGESTEKERFIRDTHPLYSHIVVAQIIKSGKSFNPSKEAMKFIVDHSEEGEDVLYDVMYSNFCEEPYKAKYINSSWCLFLSKWAPSDAYILNPHEEDYYCKFFIRSKNIVLNFISFHFPRFSYK